jgi:alkylhydroperoxidase family enzyme
LLAYASKLTDSPGLVNEKDTMQLAEAGWSEQAIWEITTLVAFFNFSGRLEASSGLPQDRIPATARLAEARTD